MSKVSNNISRLAELKNYNERICQNIIDVAFSDFYLILSFKITLSFFLMKFVHKCALSQSQ